MAARKEHRFVFKGQDIAAAAEREAAYHAERARWWNERYVEAAELAKTKGAEVREFPMTGGTRHQLVIDATLQDRINECATKRGDHQSKADRFRMEAAAYATQTDKSFELDVDDVTYFRMTGGDREPSPGES